MNLPVNTIISSLKNKSSLAYSINIKYLYINLNCKDKNAVQHNNQLRKSFAQFYYQQ